VLPSDPIRQAAQPVGVLRIVTDDGSQRACSAVIISDNYVLTSANCMSGARDAAVVFGPGGSDLIFYKIQTDPVEIDLERGYAILSVEGAPSRRFGVTKLLLRIPLKGENAFIVGVSEASASNSATGAQSNLSSSRNCSIRATDTQEAILHDCGTAYEEAGALLFSVKDMAVLGLLNARKVAPNGDFTPMYAIALKSALVRDLATVRPPMVDFRTIGNKPDEIAADFKRLYLSLHNEGRLPLRPYRIQSFGSIEDVFRTNELFFGSPFPDEIDSIACDVNPDVCTRERVDATAVELKSGSFIRDVISDPRREGGRSKPSRGKWSVTPPAFLWLPSIKIEQQEGWVAYRKRPGQEIKDIVTREFATCRQFDSRCESKILAMNRNEEARLLPAYSGVVLLPKTTFSARAIDISTAVEKNAGHAVEVKSLPGQNGTLVLQNAIIPNANSQVTSGSDYRVLQAPVSSENTSGLDAVLKSLGGTVSGAASIAPNNAGNAATPTHCKGSESNACELDPSDFSIFQKRLLDGIDFPFAKITDFPKPITDKDKGGKVGIIDTDLDLGHCAFDQLRLANRLKPIGEPIPETAPMSLGHSPCKWLKPSLNINRGNHGSHVAGLMAGRISDQWWGLNPYATLYAGQIVPTTIGQQSLVSSLSLAELLQNMLNETGLDVINLSMFYQKENIASIGPDGASSRPRGDPVLEVIRGTGYDTLFVVAAGNDGEDFTAICDMRPACLDLPNVISVAALDRQESGPYTFSPNGVSSNFGRRVHVAAPGADILGLVNGNYLGLLSGTSQAAPQVAAVASLLRAMRPNAVPGDVKERLIVCSQPVPMPVSAVNEDVNALFGGRVDSTCTLMPNGEGLLQMKESAETYRVKTFGTTGMLTFEPAVGSYKMVIPTGNLRGLRIEGYQNELTIFHKRAPEDRDASLSKDGRMRATPEEQQIEIEVWDKLLTPPKWNKRPFAINKIARFVAPMVKR
jgi:subtilisin family serine protease